MGNEEKDERIKNRKRERKKRKDDEDKIFLKLSSNYEDRKYER